MTVPTATTPLAPAASDAGRTAGPTAAFTAAIALVMLALVAAVELWMGRVPICTCGSVKLWHGVVASSENSQQVSDWYTFTHVLHGVLFYGALALAARWVPVQTRLLIAIAVEGLWEVVENSPMIIDRYRAVTISFDYYGDSVLNSVSDVAAMMLGFWLARRLSVWASVALVVATELLLAWAIRDNLSLNILMLLHPVEAVRQWQQGL